MSYEGEKTCPLCAEEMDFTDQQLKPCKCGYEICVWCWHHIMDMAEKDNVEGRCPACRTPYNKEKIVDKAAQCERLVSELSVEKKIKSKSKGKTPDGRKNLSNVRVIQRNLVYVAGLPLNLADEDLLQQEEYFPRYGKVQKVSISRTAAGTIQQFPNNTCSVYITYSKEEEAVRCIQSVHGYILEGRPLRACFGTTKYCHAWLRNMQCTNPDCLYLHEIGTQEDRFIKDEIISACTRNRVEQITGATVDVQRRSGNVLPWPVDEFCNNSSSSSGVSNSKSSTNNVDICSDSILESSVWQTPASSVRGSPPNSSCSKSVVLPATASWGMRASNRQQSPTSVTSSNGPSKQKSDACGIAVAYSTAIASPAKVSVLHSDSGKKLNGEILLTAQRNKSEPVASVQLYLDGDQQRRPSMIGHSIKQVTSSQISTPPLKVDGSMSIPADIVKSVDSRGQSCVIDSERDPHVPVVSKIQELCSHILSLNIDTQGLQQRDTAYRESSQSHTPTKAASTSKDTIASRDQSEFRLESQLHVVETDSSEVKNDLQSYDIQSFRNPEAVSCTDNRPNLTHILDGSRALYLQEAYNSPNVNVDSQPNKFSAQEYNIPVLSNGYSEDRTRSCTDLNSSDKNSSYMVSNESRMMSVGRYGGDLVNHDNFSDNYMGESSIISNILSMNFDSWDDSLASPQSLAKLLGETDKQQGSLGVSSSRKVQNSNQSRFSFAREEDQTFNYDPFFTGFNQTPKIHSFANGFKDNGIFHASEISNGLSNLGAQQPGNSASIHSHNSLNRISVSRAPVSAPPGFSGPNRAPPPGFTNYDRVEQTFDINSGKNFLDNSSFMRNTNQSLSTMHFDSANADIEFIDPAILAVGKGRFPGELTGPGFDMRSSYPTQMSNYENESRLQLMMQRSLSSQQNSRYVDMGDSFSSHPDNCGMPTRISERALANNGSQYSQFARPQSRNQPISNGNWDGWSEVKGENDSRIAEFLRSERLGINKYFTGYEDSKYRMPNSGDLYNQTYGI